VKKVGITNSQPSYYTEALNADSKSLTPPPLSECVCVLIKRREEGGRGEL